MRNILLMLFMILVLGSCDQNNVTDTHVKVNEPDGESFLKHSSSIVDTIEVSERSKQPNLETIQFLQPTVQTNHVTIFEINHDVELFEFVVEEDSLILFDSDYYFYVIVYGKDNPNMFQWYIGGGYPFVIPAGSYYLQLPIEVTQANESYDIIMELSTFFPEEVVYQTYDSYYTVQEAVLETSVYQFNLQFDYAGDVEYITFDLEPDTYVSYTIERRLDCTGTILEDGELLPYDISSLISSEDIFNRMNISYRNDYEGTIVLEIESDQTITYLDYADKLSTIQMLYGEVMIEIVVIRRTV